MTENEIQTNTLPDILKKAEQIRNSNKRISSKKKINIYHAAADACRSIGNYDEAIKYFELELHESELLELHDDILYCHRFLGECYLNKNKYNESEKYHLKFLSLAKQYGNDERIEQAYTCLANTYWLWLSYLQDDLLYDNECDQLTRDLCQRSLDASFNSLHIIEKLDSNVNDIEHKEQDFALRRVRSYINIANAVSDKYINDGKDNENLKLYSQYIKNAIQLAKKYNFYEELARLHSSIAGFYLTMSNCITYKKEIISTMEQAMNYAKLSHNIDEYLSCIHDIALTFISFDDYQNAEKYLIKLCQYEIDENPIKEAATQDLTNLQRILTGLEDHYKKETDLRRKMSLAEQCADTFSHLNRHELSKIYYLKQLKHAQELNLDESQMATIYSSLGSVYQDLKQWQLSIDYFRREMSCRINYDANADIEQVYSLCEIIKCEYRLKIDRALRIRTLKRVLTIARSIDDNNLIRKTVALVFAMKLRDPLICLNNDLDKFMADVQPAITEENYYEILRCSETISNEKIEQQLINKQKDRLNHSYSYGWTPLHRAAFHGNSHILRYVLNRRSINIDSQTNNGITALVCACYKGHFNTIEILLTYGARIDIRTKNGYTAVDYLSNYHQTISSDDNKTFIRLKQLLLTTMRRDHPNYCIKKILNCDFSDKTIVETSTSNVAFDEFVLNQCSNKFKRKRESTINDSQSLSSNSTEMHCTDNFDYLLPIENNFFTMSNENHTIIIRCFANTVHRTVGDRKIRIPMLPTDTITNLRYQVLKRLYDNYNICACSVILYDKQDWELGMSDNDTIQLSLPHNECDIKAIFVEKDPVIIYEQICRDSSLVVYSNVRLILKNFFNKFHISLQRLCLKSEQTMNILKVFEHFMFIYAIDLSENNLTDDIFSQLKKLTLDQLKSLNLSKNKFTTSGLKTFFEEKVMKNLTLIDLSGNIDIDFDYLLFLRIHFPKLTVHF